MLNIGITPIAIWELCDYYGILSENLGFTMMFKPPSVGRFLASGGLWYMKKHWNCHPQFPNSSIPNTGGLLLVWFIWFCVWIDSIDMPYIYIYILYMLHKTDIGESITCRTALHEKHQSLIVPDAIEYEYLRYPTSLESKLRELLLNLYWANPPFIFAFLQPKCSLGFPKMALFVGYPCLSHGESLNFTVFTWLFSYKMARCLWCKRM